MEENASSSSSSSAAMQETANAAGILGAQGSEQTGNKLKLRCMHEMSSTWAFVRQHANLTEMVHGAYCELFGPPNELSIYGERVFEGLRKLLGELIGRSAPGYWGFETANAAGIVQAGWFFPPSPSCKDGAFSKSNALAPMSEDI